MIKRYYNSRQLALLQITTTCYLHLTIAWLLQFLTNVITINDRYYNLRRLLLQLTTCITTHDIITIHDRYPPMICSPLLAKQYFPRQRRPVGVLRLRTTWSSLWEVICHKKVQQSFLNQSLDPLYKNSWIRLWLFFLLTLLHIFSHFFSLCFLHIIIFYWINLAPHY